MLSQVDTNQLLEQLDVNEIADQIDVDALVDRLDVNLIAERLDIDALVERLDVNLIADRLDLDALIERLDVNLIADRLDLDALIERLDINKIAAQLDIDALIDRLDINEIAERIDLDALIARLNMAQLTAGATQDVATSGLDLVRRQVMRADATVEATVDRLLRREPDARPEAPGDLAIPEVAEPEPAIKPGTRPERRRDVSGHYAGPVTRLLALAGDSFASLAVFGSLGAVTLYLLTALFGLDVTFSSGGWVTQALLVLWLFLWFSVPVALFGRTAAMALAGLAVVTRDGGVVHRRAAIIRALVTPISLLFFGLGLIGMVVGRERRTLQDVAAGTVVVYDWGARQAEQPATVRDMLSARVRRHQAQESPGSAPAPQ